MEKRIQTSLLNLRNFQNVTIFFNLVAGLQSTQIFCLAFFNPVAGLHTVYAQRFSWAEKRR